MVLSSSMKIDRLIDWIEDIFKKQKANFWAKSTKKMRERQKLRPKKHIFSLNI